MSEKPNMQKLESLRQIIGNHLADIAELLDPSYKLTFVARFPGQHSKTIIVTDDEDVCAVTRELSSSDDLITVKADGGGPFDAAVDRVIARVDKGLEGRS